MPANVVVIEKGKSMNVHDIDDIVRVTWISYIAS